MKTNLFIQALSAALLLVAAPVGTRAASLLGDVTFDNLPVGNAPSPNEPAGRWHFIQNNTRWEPSPEGVSIVPAPAGGDGNALRFSWGPNQATWHSVDLYNYLALPVYTDSGQIVNVSFDVYVSSPQVGGVAINLNGDSDDTDWAVSASWSWGATNITDLFLETPGSKFVAVPSYPKGVWQTVRFEIDLASWRYNFYWSVKGQPVSVILTNLVCPSARFSRITNLSIDRYSNFTTATDFYIDNIVVSAGPPAAVTPAHAIVAPGGSVTLSPTNILAVPSSYQWQFNGTNLPGATSSNLTLSNLSLDDDRSGLYSVVVSNAFEVVTATAAQVEVVDRVTIARSPVSTNVPAGSDVTLGVTAVSPLPITYQWQFNGTDLPGQTGSTLTLNNVQLANEGLYTVVATDALRSVTSEAGNLVVLVKPGIIQAPLSQSVVAGGSVTFSTEITGNPAPFLYQWRQGSTILTNIVQTGKKGFFTLNNVQPSQAGQYQVVITNAALSTLRLKATWNLTVLPDTDGDGLPDAFETAHGLNPADAASCLKLERVTEANGMASVSFNAASNQTYTVEWCADLDGGAWTKLTDVIARPDNRTETVTDSTATDAARFYRVRPPRKP